MNANPSFVKVFLTLPQNSLVRDSMFRTNFLLQCLSSLSWTVMNIGFYLLVFRHTPTIGLESGWGKYEFFVFLATTWIINSLMQTFFMPNADEFSELIRTGNLDFALLKPIDTQFLISFQRVDWSSLADFVAAVVLLTVALGNLTTRPDDPLLLSGWTPVLYVVYVLCGVGILYSVMICAGFHERLVGAQPEPVRFLVLHHQFLQISPGDLPARVGRAVVGLLQLRDSGAGGRERSGTPAGASRCVRSRA